MLIGGLLDSGKITATVLKFNSSNLSNDPILIQSMVHERYGHACTIFKSPLHDGRSIAIIAGGCCGSAENKAEVLDFTKDGASWQESNLIFASIYLLFLNFSKKGYAVYQIF